MKNSLKKRTRFIIPISLLIFILISTNLIVIGQDDDDDEVSSLCVLNDILIQDMDSTVVGAGGDIINPDEDDNTDYLRDGWLDINEDGLSISQNRSYEANEDVVLMVLDDFTTPIAHQTHGEYVLEIVQGVARNATSQIHPINYADSESDEPVRLDHIASRLRTEIEDYRAVDGNEGNLIIVNMSWVILRCKDNFDILYENTDGEYELEPIEIDILRFLGERNGQENLVHYIIRIAREEYGLNIDIEELTQFNYLSFRSALANSIGQTGQVLQNSDADINCDTDPDEFPSWGYWCLQEILDQDGVIGVGAAGNMNQVLGEQVMIELPKDDNNNFIRDSFEPASWESVIAVSGTVMNAPSLDRLPLMWMPSHDGQIAAPAAWYRFSTGEFGSGTSFSTPLVSGLMLRYAMRGCDVGNLLQIGEGQNMFYINAFHTYC